MDAKLRVLADSSRVTEHAGGASSSCSSRWLCPFVRCALILFAYYTSACAIFYYGEEPGWRIIDSVYFSTVVMSTVGYGDIVPTTTFTRTMTVILAFVGIAMVFTQVLSIIDAFNSRLVRWMDRQFSELFPSAILQMEGLDGSLLEVEVPTQAVIFYAQRLMPVMTMWIVLQLGFAGLLCAAQPMDYGISLYHMMMTSTTVGLGDVAIDSDGCASPDGSNSRQEWRRSRAKERA